MAASSYAAHQARCASCAKPIPGSEAAAVRRALVFFEQVVVRPENKELREKFAGDTAVLATSMFMATRTLDAYQIAIRAVEYAIFESPSHPTHPTQLELSLMLTTYYAHDLLLPHEPRLDFIWNDLKASLEKPRNLAVLLGLNPERAVSNPNKITNAIVYASMLAHVAPKPNSYGALVDKFRDQARKLYTKWKNVDRFYLVTHVVLAYSLYGAESLEDAEGFDPEREFIGFALTKVKDDVDLLGELVFTAHLLGMEVPDDARKALLRGERGERTGRFTDSEDAFQLYHTSFAAVVGLSPWLRSN
jgi:hypothetical protein